METNWATAQDREVHCMLANFAQNSQGSLKCMRKKKFKERKLFRSFEKCTPAGQGGFLSNRPFHSCGLTILSCICRENVTE